MKQFLLQFFSWWHGQTLSVRFFTWAKGEYVGSDSFGNRYYCNKQGARWVVYAGEVDASSIPPDWHGWIHGRRDDVPNNEKQYAWQKPHMANKTGSSESYRPDGVKRIRKQGKLSADYEAWKG